MAKQLSFNRTSGWGGRRPGAGRKNVSNTVNHMERPSVNLKYPLHITLRLKERLPSIRNRTLLNEFKESMKKAKVLGLYVIHFSIQSNHIHLFAEAEENKALSRGMRALAGRFAKFVRAYSWQRGAQRKGSVFKGRYHLRILKTPRETRNALEYVLLNTSKHLKVIEHIDPFSSGRVFERWPLLLGDWFKALIRWGADFPLKNSPGHDLREILSTPRSWLAQTGWTRALG